MEKGFKSWFNHQHTDWQSPNSNPLSAPFGLGQQNNVPPYMNACTNMLSPNNGSNRTHVNEPRGWFYGLPRYRQSFGPVLNSVPKEKLPACLIENYEGDGASTGVQKRFLVFDQSGDQTTLIFSSAIRAPVQYLPSWSPKPHFAFELKKEEPGIKVDAIHSTRPFSMDEYNQENEKDVVRSEMHEDTEELNALLYSDDDEIDYSEDEEETSTGHSPSTMSGYDRQYWAEQSGEEEVASSAGPAAKRLKVVNGGEVVPSSLMDTASSLKTDKKSFDYEDDAQFSCCGDGGRNHVFGEELGSLSGNKRSRKEKIRETISILQNLIPGGKKGKDTIVVLDEAIHYLRSLKFKAQALGLDSL